MVGNSEDSDEDADYEYAKHEFFRDNDVKEGVLALKSDASSLS